MTDLVKGTAEALEIGNLFVFSREGKETFGIRTRSLVLRPEDHSFLLLYTDLVTGELHPLLPSQEVEVIPNFGEFIRHFYQADMKPIHDIHDVMDFFDYE